MECAKGGRAIWFVTLDYVGRAMPGGAATRVIEGHDIGLFPAIASDGAIWYDPNDGASVRRRDPDGSILTMSLPPIRAYKLAPSTDGAVWAITLQNVYRINKTGFIRQFPLPGGPIDMAPAPDGGVWVATVFGIYPYRMIRFDAEGREVESMTADWPDAMGTGPDGSLFLASRGEIRRYLAGRSQTIRIDDQTACSTASGVTFAFGWSFARLAVSSDGVLWLAQDLRQVANVTMIPPPCSPPPETWALVRVGTSTWPVGRRRASAH